MTALLLAAPVLASLLLGAHFFRSGSAAGVVAALLPLPLVFVRRPWAARATQAILVLGAAEWIRTLALLVEERRAAALPHARLALILGAVAALTAASAFVFETRRLRDRYGTARRA